jgi:hypothetical protein
MDELFVALCAVGERAGKEKYAAEVDQDFIKEREDRGKICDGRRTYFEENQNKNFRVVFI